MVLQWYAWYSAEQAAYDGFTCLYKSLDGSADVEVTKVSLVKNSEPDWPDAKFLGGVGEFVEAKRFAMAPQYANINSATSSRNGTSSISESHQQVLH